MLFHNVLDYKLWAFEHLWAPGALKTVEERATLHSHFVPFGDAALTAGSHIKRTRWGRESCVAYVTARMLLVVPYMSAHWATNQKQYKLADR